MVAAGSLMPQTAAQIRQLRQSGIPWRKLDAKRLIGEGPRGMYARGIADELGSLIREGFDALVYTANLPEEAAETKRHSECRR